LYERFISFNLNSIPTVSGVNESEFNIRRSLAYIQPNYSRQYKIILNSKLKYNSFYNHLISIFIEEAKLRHAYLLRNFSLTPTYL